MTIRNLALVLCLMVIILRPISAQEEQPDSELIAFASNRSGTFQIYLINNDGSGLTRVTEDETDDTMPRWSPDGSQIAYIAQIPRTSTRQLSFLNLADDSVTTLDDMDRTGGIFSPDGEQIAYNAQAESVELFISDLDGTNSIQLTRNWFIDDVSDWHPDGELLLFTSDSGGNGNWQDHVDIYTLNIDTEEFTRLTDTPEREFNPVWSPDGSQIAFAYEIDGNRDIYVMDSNGENLTRLTTDPGYDHYPSWSPDGTRLVFQSDRYGNDALFILDLEKGTETLLTDHFKDERHPAWIRVPLDSEDEESGA